jgi:20S proteasome alpha/beta subunit
MVLLANERAAVLASDSFERASNAGLTSTSRRKVDKIGANLILGMSGIGAFSDGNGTVVVDLQRSLPPVAVTLSWSEPEVDAQELHKAIFNQLRPLTQNLFGGPPDHSLQPHVTVLLAGISRRKGIFAVRFKYPGTYIEEGPNHRVSFSAGSWDLFPIRQRKLMSLILTRLEEVEREARDVLAGRNLTILRYPSIRRLYESNVHVDEKILRAAAEDLVKFTMDRDSSIGGRIQVVSLSSGDRQSTPTNPPSTHKK